MRVREVAGGGRAVEVEPERVAGWFDRFAARHGGLASTRWQPPVVHVLAADGSRVEVVVPFGGLAGLAGLSGSAGERDGVIDELVAHLLASRRIGLLLVRLGGYSVGVAQDGRVLTSSTGARQVHGRAKPGGQSSTRFVRRREGQVRVALQAAADTAARVLLPVADTLDAVVLGGDSSALDALRADSRLATLLARAEPRVLDVPEPRRAVLDDAARRARSVEIVVHEPA